MHPRLCLQSDLRAKGRYAEGFDLDGLPLLDGGRPFFGGGVDDPCLGGNRMGNELNKLAVWGKIYRKIPLLVG